jgi:galactonate dehydratase
MKLIKATPFVVRTPPPNYGGYFFYFVKLETDSGLVGWGESAVLFSMYGLERAFEALVDGAFNRYLAGRDPMNREMLSKVMYAGLSSQHADYFVGGLISAFDTAMWDICGKALGVPVCDLLGGRFRSRIRTYTYLYDVDGQGDLARSALAWSSDPKRVGEIAARLVDEGFTGVKLDPLRYTLPGAQPIAPWEVSMTEYDCAERTIEAIRTAVGDRADIMIGTHGQITPSVSRRLAKRLENTIRSGSRSHAPRRTSKRWRASPPARPSPSRPVNGWRTSTISSGCSQRAPAISPSPISAAAAASPRQSRSPRSRKPITC